MLQKIHTVSLGPGLIPWYDLSNETGMRFGTWNVMSLYRAGSLMEAAKELTRYKLDLVGVQKVRWDKGGMVRRRDYSFSMKIINWEQDFLYTTK